MNSKVDQSDNMNEAIPAFTQQIEASREAKVKHIWQSWHIYMYAGFVPRICTFRPFDHTLLCHGDDPTSLRFHPSLWPSVWAWHRRVARLAATALLHRSSLKGSCGWWHLAGVEPETLRQTRWNPFISDNMRSFSENILELRTHVYSIYIYTIM